MNSNIIRRNKQMFDRCLARSGAVRKENPAVGEGSGRATELCECDFGVPLDWPTEFHLSRDSGANMKHM
jgi:hypothetical protein